MVPINDNNESSQRLSPVHSHDIHDKSDSVIPAGCCLHSMLLTVILLKCEAQTGDWRLETGDWTAETPIIIT